MKQTNQNETIHPVTRSMASSDSGQTSGDSGRETPTTNEPKEIVLKELFKFDSNFYRRNISIRF